MIIHAVHSENLLKYQILELTNLPENGLIAICGQNEAGKSTTGEVICFALFGRTFSLPPEQLSKAIRWGESRASVTVTFSVGDGKRYQVTRFLDDESNQGALINEEGKEDDPLVRGVDGVAHKLRELIGFEYEEFIESFYLAQRELTTPHAHSHAVKTMAGIAALEEVAAEIEETVPGEEELLDQNEGRLQTVDGQLDELGLDESLLGTLQEDRATWLEGETVKTKAMEALQGDVKGYVFMVSQLDANQQRDQASRSLSRFGAVLFFLLTALLGTVWALLTQQPDSPQSQDLAKFLADTIPDWQNVPLAALLYGAIATLVIWVVFMMRSGAAKKRLQISKQQHLEIAAKLGQSFQALRQLESLEEVSESEEEAEMPADDTVADRVAEAEAEVETEEPAAVDEQMSELQAALLQRSAGLEAVKGLVGQEMRAAEQDVALYRQQISELDEQIGSEQERHAQAADLLAIKRDLEAKKAAYEMSLQVRATALDLLGGSFRHITNRFNRDVRVMAGKSLPSLTSGRYQHLEIDEDLNVRVFSNEKRDFMVLDEVSSGTQRQIMLALRLALSQELVNTAINGGQFLFLDEPFAFFDEQRMRSSLEVLPTISDELTQIFVISQEFPADVNFDMVIDCSRQTLELAVDGAAAA